MVYIRCTHQKAPRASCSSFNKIYYIYRYWLHKIYLHWKYFECITHTHTHTHIVRLHCAHTYFLQPFHKLAIKLPFHWKRGRNCVQTDIIIRLYRARTCMCLPLRIVNVYIASKCAKSPFSNHHHRHQHRCLMLSISQNCPSKSHMYIA